MSDNVDGASLDNAAFYGTFNFKKSEIKSKREGERAKSSEL